MEFTAPSGALVKINVAPWKEAKLLKMALEREITACDLTNLLQSVIHVDSSPAVDAVLWPCLNRCLRDGQKITETTFDAVEARADYYDIVVACVKENFIPLVESLSSKLSEAGIMKKKSDATPQPESPTS